MDGVTRFHFNRLPQPARERLVACLADRDSPSPTLRQPVDGPGRAVWMALLALVGLGVVVWRWESGFAALRDRGSIVGPEAIGVFAIGFAALLVPIGWAIGRWLEARRLPYRRGVYVLGAHVVDARSEIIHCEPVLATRCEVRSFTTSQGFLAGATLTFHGQGGQRYVFHVDGRLELDHATQVLGADLTRAVAAAEAADWSAVRALDPLFEARDAWRHLAGNAPPLPVDEPRALPRPVMARLAPVVALGAALAAAPAAWMLRNQRSDDAMFAAARSEGDLRAYLDRGSRHTGEARQRLHRVTLDGAIARRSVTALRAWQREFADAAAPLQQQATASIHALFEDALSRFRIKADGGDPRALAFVNQLLAHAERNGSPPLVVRFRPPAVAQLDVIDRLLAAEAEASKGTYDFAPLAPYFSDQGAAAREARIVEALGKGFREVFPNDMLSLTAGPRIADGGSGGADEIEVGYHVDALADPDGGLMLYTLEPTINGLPTRPRLDDQPLGGHLYVGIEVRFDVTMRIPGADPYTMTVRVRPPDRFAVDPGSDDGDIYRIMADHAFDELRTKLDASFFGR